MTEHKWNTLRFKYTELALNVMIHLELISLLCGARCAMTKCQHVTINDHHVTSAYFAIGSAFIDHLGRVRVPSAVMSDSSLDMDSTADNEFSSYTSQQEISPVRHVQVGVAANPMPCSSFIIA